MLHGNTTVRRDDMVRATTTTTRSTPIRRSSTADAQRSRHALNADTIREMHAAFRRGGRKAIEMVMRNQPAVFLKLLVLLVPRQMTLDHSGGVKAMSDEQIERSIELIKGMLAERAAAANAKVIGGIAEPVPALPPPCRERKKTAPPSAGKTS
jgi:hypothetical protein